VLQCVATLLDEHAPTAAFDTVQVLFFLVAKGTRHICFLKGLLLMI